VGITVFHTADWQIGKAFGGIGGDAAVLLRAQRLKTVQRIAQEATVRGADAVLVAGDVFETNLVTNETMYGLLHALEGFKGPWVLVPGNHDPATPESVWHRIESVERPENVHIALDTAPIELADGRLAVLPVALQRKHEFEDLTAAWDGISTPAGAVRVGLAHGTVEGRLPAQSEATNPIAADREVRARLDYLALGDWHGTYQISEHTWYSGTPEPDRFKDNAPGNVLVVKIAGPGAKPEIERLCVAAYTWHSLEAELTTSEDLTVLDAKFTALGEPFDRHIVTVALRGVVDLGMREQIDRLLSKWRGRFTSLGEDISGLLAQPTDADLDRIDTAGFVRAAMEQLRAIHGDPSAPHQPYALGALRLLYQIHTAGADTR